ncbi:hypothetical protein [Staphylococcus gallinarum]|uniref:N-acetyltransferase domain-containing protein n=2 Tax=Staphylococcus gallinarum TaxID=1293 RepID=A0A0D0SE47_STAGA|nr:hypothetical protein [Staphylococcus gallinarum]KIR10480.1 hypothetical protein SH09_12885 [Staphylococcus gallinarum]GEQ06570.1 hypothetical protein SGA02_23980 [Staphylococcus gallinarum]SUQ38624.1 Putative uncharacterized protein SAVP022 [Staphylococcus gallinarum]
MKKINKKILEHHEIIRNNLEIEDYKNMVKNEAVKLNTQMEKFVNDPNLNIDIFNNKNSEYVTADQTVVYYYVKITQIFSDYYITKDINEFNSFDIFSEDFKMVGRIRISADFINQEHENPYIKKLFNKHGYMLELINLNSFSKGYGESFVNKLKKLSKITKLPIWLYDTNSKGKNYFRKMGFKHKGNLGENNEPLMFYKPK